VETLPLAEIKNRLSEFVERVSSQHDRVTITRNGRPAAVLVSPEDLESLEETLSILGDSEELRALQEGRVDRDVGRVVSLEDRPAAASVSDAYQVVIAASAARDVGRLPTAVRRPILAALDALAEEPRAGKPLTGALRVLWSLRRGDYRIVYRVDDPARKVEVARVGFERSYMTQAAQ